MREFLRVAGLTTFRIVVVSSRTGRSALNRFRRFFGNLGPGLITGAADDDPSGISTYSVTGAAFGYAPLWTALFSFPLMAGVQLMCARLGMVTGRGLAGVLRRRYPRRILWGACSLLIVAKSSTSRRTSRSEEHTSELQSRT